MRRTNSGVVYFLCIYSSQATCKPVLSLLFFLLLFLCDCSIVLQKRSLADLLREDLVEGEPGAL